MALAPPRVAPPPTAKPREGAGGRKGWGTLRLSRRLLAALALLSLLVHAPARAEVGDTAARLADPALEQRAREIGKELRCLVCQNQSIEDSDATLARDLRRIVREQVATGATDADIRRFVHDRYGDFVLLRPPIKPATLLLWSTPLLALLGGGLLIWRSRRRAVPTIGDTELSEAERARLATLEGPRHP